MTTYEDVHTGATVLGHDGEVWGVLHIEHEPTLAVTLVRGPHRITGRPPAGTEVVVIAPADVTAEARAAQTLIDGGFDVELIRETWEA